MIAAHLKHPDGRHAMSYTVADTMQYQRAGFVIVSAETYRAGAAQGMRQTPSAAGIPEPPFSDEDTRPVRAVRP